MKLCMKRSTKLRMKFGMKKNRILLTFFVIVSTCFLSGCWDRIEIEERATVLALAIDPLDGEIRDNITGEFAKSNVSGYKLTAQIAIPGRIPLGPGGGTGGTSSDKPVWLVNATGKTIADAMNTLQMELAEKLFLGHLRVIIVNQQLARSTGMTDIQDFFRRDAEIRRLAWLLVSSGSAFAAMEASPKLERIPTLYLVSTMDRAVQLGRIPNIFLGNYWSVLSSQGQEPVLPQISVISKDQIELNGLAAFRNDEMITSLNPLEVAAFMEIQNIHRSGYAIALPMPGDPAHSVIVRGANRKTRIKMRIENGKPAFDIYSRVEVNIQEKTGSQMVDLKVNEVAREASQVLGKGQENLINKMKSLHSDIFGFGEKVRGMYPAYWRKIGTRDRWDEEFAQLPVRVHVKVFIRRSGMTTH